MLDLGLWQISSITSDGHMVGCVGYCTIICEKRPKFYFTWDVTHLMTYGFRGGGGGSLQGAREGGIDRSSSRLLNFRVVLVASGSLIAGVNESHGNISESGHLLMPHNGRLWLTFWFYILWYPLRYPLSSLGLGKQCRDAERTMDEASDHMQPLWRAETGKIVLSQPYFFMT